MLVVVMIVWLKIRMVQCMFKILSLQSAVIRDDGCPTAVGDCIMAEILCSWVIFLDNTDQNVPVFTLYILSK